jgi:hypothetical protein
MVIGCGDVLELLLSLLVSRVQIRMQFLGEPAIRLLDVRLRRIPLHTQDRVGIGRQIALLSLVGSIPGSRRSFL